MNRILYIQASPRAERSHSITVADAFFVAHRELHPEDEIDVFNIFIEDLPTFDGLAVQAKYTILHGKKHSDAELLAWAGVEKIIERFTRADKYIMAVPMWNFGIPYRLKQLFDIIVQPGYTFSYSPDEGYKGLIIDKPIFIAYARGGEYPEGTEAEGADFQKKYLELILGFIGFTEIKSIVVEPTLQGGPDQAAARREAAVEQARELAKTF